MFIAALLHTDLQLAPLEKYFLVRFVQCFGVLETAAAGVKVLAQQLGIADQQVSAALRTLISCNILSCMPAEPRRGRPKAKYKISKTFALELSSRKPEGEVRHPEILSRLILNKGKSAVKDMTDLRPGLSTGSKMAALRERRDFSQLGTINRLLLCVLIYHADRFGVVRSLSTAAICNMTGLTREKLKHRVQRLTEQGFICHYVAGATSGTINGRMTSVYFLDLCHPQIRGLTSQPEKLVVSKSLHESEPYDQALSTYHDVVLNSP